MGRMFQKVQPPIAPPILLTPVKKFVRELSVLFENNSPEALETNSTVNESTGKLI